MKISIAFFFLIIYHVVATAQGFDFILLKKNEHTIKTLYAGTIISIGTSTGNFSGKIYSIYKDSIYFLQYDVRQVQTNLGVYILDTVATYKLRFNYHDIAYIGHKPSGFNWSASGGTLLGGGIVLTTVGMGTWLFTKPGTRYYASPTLVIGSAILGGVGYLLLKSNNSYKLGSKYHLEYVGTAKQKK